MKNFVKRLWQEEEGQDLVEYGLLLVLVSLGAVASMGTLASAISGAVRQRIEESFQQLITPPIFVIKDGFPGSLAVAQAVRPAREKVHLVFCVVPPG